MQAFLESFDATLLITIALIFGATLIGAYIRSNRRDPCLKSFENYHVTLERASGKVIWGVLELEPTGLELRYRDSVQDSNHVESSYFLYASEYSDIQAIYRYVDDLNEEDRRRRQRDLDRYFHPGPAVRILRGLQHFFSLAGESLSEVLAILMGSLRKPAGRYISDTSEVHLKKLGSTVIGRVGGAFDPLLERCIGQKVVIDLAEGDEAHEHVGIFKNYSPDFIEILDVQYPQQQTLDVATEGDLIAQALQVHREGKALHVKNLTAQPILIQSLTLDGKEEEPLSAIVDGGEVIELFPEKDYQKATLNVRVVRELDMIVPRTRCLVRHRAERYEPTIIPEIVFDLGVMLTGNSVTEAREARLRKMLEESPKSAKVASNLGALLMQKGEYAEAEELLQRAYNLRFSLPDNGKRTMMLLRECRRRQAKSPDQAARRHAVFKASPTTQPDSSQPAGQNGQNGQDYQQPITITTEVS
jgi:tetratricopeptide (TPR) repeat protein